MPRTATAPQLIHPAGESRIERVARELDELAKAKAAILAQEADLKARLLLLTKREGTPDEKGKIRYATDQHRFVVVEGRNEYCHIGKLKVALTSAGLTPKAQRTVLKAAVTSTEYEYVHRSPVPQEKA